MCFHRIGRILSESRRQVRRYENGREGCKEGSRAVECSVFSGEGGLGLDAWEVGEVTPTPVLSRKIADFWIEVERRKKEEDRKKGINT